MSENARTPGPEPRLITLTADHAWPIGIALALFVVIMVNVAFIVIAVSGQDEVAASYVEGER